jgi:23S rRNA G2445 N2-methylase RlmL
MKFLLHTQIGIENITELELLSKYKSDYSLDYAGYVPHKNGIVQVDWRNEATYDFYKNIGTIEDAYVILSFTKDINAEANLTSIYKLLDGDEIKKNLDYFFDKLNIFDKSGKFRFVTRKKSPHEFRRIDLDEMVQDFFKKNLKRVDVTDEEGVKEIWTTLIKNRLIISVRLTPKDLRTGYYKKASVNGSLRPSVAYAMSFVADFHSKDTVWDPFCGAGTIGCEVSENFKFKKLINSDISTEAIDAAKINYSNLKSYKQNKGKITFKVEDFFKSNMYADIIITNLPFGNKYEINEDFIKEFFLKSFDVKDLNQIVILFPEAVESYSWQLTRKFPVQILGYPAFILVYKRKTI